MSRNKGTYSKSDLELLSSKSGIENLLAHDPVDVSHALAKTQYETQLKELQKQLVEVQKWVIERNERIAVIFEGRDAAGKGGAIREITAHINPRHFRTIALPKPTEEERGEWYFQRYIQALPGPGQMVFFDRSWYNRAVVEPVNGFCTESEYEVFMGQVNDFERMQVESGTLLIKLYFSISKDEQARRFKEIRKNPLTRWKMTKVDQKAQDLWDDYTRYQDAMFARTDTALAPWKVIDANDTMTARLQALHYNLNRTPNR